MYQILKGIFSRNSKLILQHLGHSSSGPQTKNSNVRKLSDVFYHILKDFFDKKGQSKYPQNPAAFIQSELARKRNWEVFSTSHPLFKEAKKLSKQVGKINSAV